jgi:hypothetical protein
LFKLKPGLNTITIVATDNNSNQTTVTRNITYDKNAPKLTIDSPDDSLRTSEPFITVSGSVDENSTVTTSVNESAPEFASINGNKFTSTVYLVPGLNTLIIKGKDVAGNSSSHKRTVFFDNVKPDLTLKNPAKDMTTKKAKLVLKGKVKETTGEVSVSVTVGDTTYTPAVSKGSFSQTINFTSAGEYDIVVTATDSTGSSTIERIVNYQPQVDDNDD